MNIFQKLFKYKCATCGETHEGSPSFSFPSPLDFEKKLDKNNENLSSDFYTTEDDYFIRTILEIPIIGSNEPFMWGVWVSQSKENFNFYFEHFNDDLLGRETFGWFSNKLPYYKSTLSLKTMASFQNNGERPKLHLEESDHELSKDFHNGISIDKAIKIATVAMHKYILE